MFYERCGQHGIFYVFVVAARAAFIVTISGSTVHDCYGVAKPIAHTLEDINAQMSSRFLTQDRMLGLRQE